MKFWGGILFLILAVWQGYATFNYWRKPQQNSNQQSSPVNLVSGVVMSLVFLVLGILIVTHRL